MYGKLVTHHPLEWVYENLVIITILKQRGAIYEMTPLRTDFNACFYFILYPATAAMLSALVGAAGRVVRAYVKAVPTGSPAS